MPTPRSHPQEPPWKRGDTPLPHPDTSRCDISVFPRGLPDRPPQAGICPPSCSGFYPGGCTHHPIRRERFSPGGLLLPASPTPPEPHSALHGTAQRSPRTTTTCPLSQLLDTVPQPHPAERPPSEPSPLLIPEELPAPLQALGRGGGGTAAGVAQELICAPKCGSLRGAAPAHAASTADLSRMSPSTDNRILGLVLRPLSRGNESPNTATTPRRSPGDKHD